MKARDLKILKNAAEILKKSDVAKECPDYCYGCFQCLGAHLVKEFDGLVNDWLISDEDCKEMEKRWKKREYDKKTVKM